MPARGPEGQDGKLRIGIIRGTKKGLLASLGRIHQGQAPEVVDHRQYCKLPWNRNRSLYLGWLWFFFHRLEHRSIQRLEAQWPFPRIFRSLTPNFGLQTPISRNELGFTGRGARTGNGEWIACAR